MNYKKLYHSIIKNRQENPLSTKTYGEKHHIIPRSLGGPDTPENLVRLSAREHFICHYLLFKMYPKDSFEWHKMTHAFTMMKAISGKQNRYFNSRLYAEANKYKSVIMSKAQSGEKNSHYGTKWIFKFNPLDFNDKEEKRIPKDEPIPKGWHSGRKMTKVRPCAVCGTAMIKPVPKKKYCSAECRQTMARGCILDGREAEFLALYDANKSMNQSLKTMGIVDGSKGGWYDWAKRTIANRGKICVQ